MIYFVRHGQTDWNKQGYLQGQSDIPLNEEGMRQAQQTRDALKNIRMDAVYCSPLQRTRETAQIIVGKQNLEIHEDPRLLERSFGEMEGSHKSEWDFKSFWKFDALPQHGMEPLQTLFQRVYAFLDSIQEEACNHHILIVAHGGISIPFQCYFDEEHRKKELTSLILKNCEVAQRESKWKNQVMKG